MKKILTLLIISLFFYTQNSAQTHHFKFQIQNKNEIKKFTQIISIDNYKNNTIWAYANDKEFEKFSRLGYKIEELPLHDNQAKVINMATTVADMANWDKYPTYDVYVQMMQDFAANYPNICKLDTIGFSQQNRLILALKISDNVNTNEAEPEFFYTSTMHGDETTGIVLMLRLADYLLSNYGTDTEATDLVNNFEIFINPEANPDGTYYGSNDDVSGSRRYLYNNTDPNRDFPDPRIGANTPYAQETQDMMTFADNHHFVMSVNFHGGAEVVNYPWDTWDSSNSHADDTWYQYISKNYVDTARLQNSSYMTSVTSSGVTEGGDWYVITGGRQDYMNYYKHCREVTIELSNTKTLSSDQLPAYWTYNERSFLNYIKEAGYGFNGTVKNTNGDPLNAKIEITGYDKDSSNVVTDPANGDYYRPIAPGTYDVTYSSFGYTSQTLTVTVADRETTTIQNVILGISPTAHTLSGNVIEDGTGNVIENVKIEILDTPTNPVYTITDGTYTKIALEDGTYSVTASKNGYLSDTLQVTISGSDKVLNFTLKPNIIISGKITDVLTGTPLENAKVEILNTSIPFVYTNSAGEYAIDNIPQITQHIKASKTGYTAVTKTVDITASNTTVDFTLAASNAISFETDIPSIFTFAGNADWIRVTPEAYDGDYSMKSGDISDNQTSVMQSELNITTAGNISFYKKVSSEGGFDFLRFYIDDTQQGSSWSGEVGWSQESFPVTTGIHTFKWEYSKDGLYDNGNDCAWIDFITFPEYDTSGINNLNKSEIMIFPNPSDGNFSVKSAYTIKQINITDITGKLIQTINTDSKQVFISNLQTGIYILSIFSENNIFRTKLIVK